MIKNYLKVAVRAILRNRLTSFINIMGPPWAMASAVLIYLFSLMNSVMTVIIQKRTERIVLPAIF